MTKSILILSAITLALFSCNDSKVYAVAPKAIAGSPLSAVSISGTVQPDQDCKELRVQYVVLDSTLKEYQKMFDVAVIRLDSLVGYNDQLVTKLIERNKEIVNETAAISAEMALRVSQPGKPFKEIITTSSNATLPL